MLCGPEVAVGNTTVITIVELEIAVPLLAGTVTVIIAVVSLLVVVVGKAKAVVLKIAVPLLAGSVMAVMPAMVVGTAKFVGKTGELEITGEPAPTKEGVTVGIVGTPGDVVLFSMNTKEGDLAISLDFYTFANTSHLRRGSRGCRDTSDRRECYGGNVVRAWKCNNSSITGEGQRS